MPDRDPTPPAGMDLSLAGEGDLEEWDFGGSDANTSLVDLVNRLLDKGVVITGDVTISVAGVDLVYLGLNAVLTSVATARRRMGQRVGSLPLDER